MIKAESRVEPRIPRKRSFVPDEETRQASVFARPAAHVLQHATLEFEESLEAELGSSMRSR